jgi:hypothetical protein
MHRIAEVIERFLTKHSGRITHLANSKRYNHQNPCPPGDGLLSCVTVHAEFANSGILGSSGSFLTEVYPRYRFLRRRLSAFLADEGLLVNVPRSTLAVSLVPTAAHDSRLGEALPQDPESSRGASILPIGKLTRQSTYYRQLANQYKIEHCLLTNKNTVVGPDAGILTTVCTAAQTFDGPIRVIEFGTGAGTTPLTLSSLDKLGSYLGNDFSPEVIEFFDTTVRPRLVGAGIDCQLAAGSCFELDISTPADLIVVGVFYQAQPDLLKLKGRAIGAALAGDGVLIIQSSKPESPFVTELLMDDPARHAAWPWYAREFSLREYFRHTAKVDVHDETMLIASNDGARLDRLATLLRQESFASTL